MLPYKWCVICASYIFDWYSKWLTASLNVKLYWWSSKKVDALKWSDRIVFIANTTNISMFTGNKFNQVPNISNFLQWLVAIKISCNSISSSFQFDSKNIVKRRIESSVRLWHVWLSVWEMCKRMKKKTTMKTVFMLNQPTNDCNV